MPAMVIDFHLVVSLPLCQCCLLYTSPKKAEAKSEPEKKETAAAEAPATDLTDDTELVAVISAAIAAVSYTHLKHTRI